VPALKQCIRPASGGIRKPSVAIDGIIDRSAAAQRRQALRLRRTRWRGLRGLTAPRRREEGIDAVNGSPCLSLAVG